MPEFSITSWLDPALDYFAKQAGIPTADFSSQFGGEAYANGLEAMADLFTKGWLNKMIQFFAGAVASGYAIWAPGVSTRFRKEFLALGTHELFRFIDPKPSDIVEMRVSIGVFTDALGRGDWNAALASVLRGPAEFQTLMGAPPAGAPTPTSTLPTPTPRPTLPSAPAPVVGTAGRSRYQISG